MQRIKCNMQRTICHLQDIRCKMQVLQQVAKYRTNARLRLVLGTVNAEALEELKQLRLEARVAAQSAPQGNVRLGSERESRPTVQQTHTRAAERTRRCAAAAAVRQGRRSPQTCHRSTCETRQALSNRKLTANSRHRHEPTANGKGTAERTSTRASAACRRRYGVGCGIVASRSQPSPSAQ